MYKGRDFFSVAQEVCKKSRLFRKIAAAIFVSSFSPLSRFPRRGNSLRLIMNFFDKQAQCQTCLSSAERRKNAHSELFAFKNAAIFKSSNLQIISSFVLCLYSRTWHAASLQFEILKFEICHCGLPHHSSLPIPNSSLFFNAFFG